MKKSYEEFTLFDLIMPSYKIDQNKKLRLITTFSGYDSQALALKYLGVKFEHYRTCEWAVKSIQALKDLHFDNDNTDYSKEFNLDYIYDYLYHKGISSNYNEPMTYDQIKRLGEQRARTIFNNIKSTKNMVNIQQVKGEDLGIVEKDKYEYLFTYSFPCQDLSLAGLRKGMKKGDSTRSGMLWEVERILDECKELNTLPNILFMENVPEVIGKNNIKDFQKWIEKLESLGYSNYVECLNSKDYGVPQKRNRCFMISILGEYSYKFPLPFKLKLRRKDLLESNVDEKYYLSKKNIQYILDMNDVALKSGRNINNSVVNPNIAKTISCRGAADQRADITNFVIDNLNQEISVKELKDLLNKEDLKIRKQTPREDFRLMGVKDEDFDKIKKNQSDSSLYHLAGDSIVVDVMKYMFKNLL